MERDGSYLCMLFVKCRNVGVFGQLISCAKASSSVIILVRLLQKSLHTVVLISCICLTLTFLVKRYLMSDLEFQVCD